MRMIHTQWCDHETGLINSEHIPRATTASMVRFLDTSRRTSDQVAPSVTRARIAQGSTAQWGENGHRCNSPYQD